VCTIVLPGAGPDWCGKSCEDQAPAVDYMRTSVMYYLEQLVVVSKDIHLSKLHEAGKNGGRQRGWIASSASADGSPPADHLRIRRAACSRGRVARRLAVAGFEGLLGLEPAGRDLAAGSAGNCLDLYQAKDRA